MEAKKAAKSRKRCLGIRRKSNEDQEPFFLMTWKEGNGRKIHCVLGTKTTLFHTEQQPVSLSLSIYSNLPPPLPPNVGVGVGGTFQMAEEEGGRGEGKEDTSGCKKYGIRQRFPFPFLVALIATHT